MPFCRTAATVIPLFLAFLTTGVYSPAFALGARSSDPVTRFVQAYELLQSKYVREVTSEELLDGAIKGMLQGLDPHSALLSAKEFADMKVSTSGSFYGVGIEITSQNGQVTVVAPIDDTPAAKAGMRAGDVILAVDGEPVQDMSTEEVVGKIRGEKGSHVELFVLHKEDKQPVTMRIVRDSIPVVSVKSRLLEDGYLWLRLTRFSERTADEMNEAIEKAGGKKLKGIVLDMRNNPGGLLDQSVEVADAFLGEGVVVSIKGRGTGEKFHNSHDSSSDVHAPLVVLVNSGSASASEIVAGALQDRQRAVLLGERTFGKGSVQTLIEQSDGSAIKLTIALYYTPNGRSIQAEGIEPDYTVPAEQRDTAMAFREKNLSRHLDKPKGDVKGKKDASARKETPAPNGEKSIEEILAVDNQLSMALEIVKGMPALSRIKP